MQPLSHQILLRLPALLCVALVLLCSLQISGGSVTYTPNVAWLMTLVMVAFYPAAWSPALAFSMGLLQDVMFATPLGAQALLALLLAHSTRVQAARQQTQRLRLRWLEAAGMLVVWHGLLWLIIEMVTPHGASLRHMLRAGLINALWYPLFYGILTRWLMALPSAKG